MRLDSDPQSPDFVWIEWTSSAKKIDQTKSAAIHKDKNCVQTKQISLILF